MEASKNNEGLTSSEIPSVGQRNDIDRCLKASCDTDLCSILVPYFKAHSLPDLLLRKVVFCAQFRVVCTTSFSFQTVNYASSTKIILKPNGKYHMIL